MKNILYTFLFKGLRGLLAGAFGWAVTKGYLSSGQTEYVIEAGAAGILWAASAFFSSVMHHLKLNLALKTDAMSQIGPQEIKAAAWVAVVDTVRNYLRNFKTKDGPNESNQ